MHNTSVKERVFLVGCPRSGTTLLQSFLAAHSQITSFPETHFFANLVPNNRLARFLGLPRRGMFSIMPAWSKTLRQQRCKTTFPRILWPAHRLPPLFVASLDDIARQMNTPVWVEKTPRHLLYVDLIEKTIPDAKFIHLVRSGADVVASLYEVTRKAASEWGTPGGRSVERCVDQWKESTELSLGYDGTPRHKLAFYDDLIENTEPCLSEICSFLGLQFEADMIKDRETHVGKILNTNEFWKVEVKGVVRNPPTEERKFFRVFDSHWQEYIISATSALTNEIEERKVQSRKVIPKA